MVEIIQVGRVLKSETKRVVRKINYTSKEITEIKLLISQEKENAKYKVDDPTEGHEKEDKKQAIYLKIKTTIELI